jgi:hypothetical protein
LHRLGKKKLEEYWEISKSGDMSWKEAYSPEAKSYNYASAFWRQRAMIEFYLKIDSSKLTLDEHMEKFAFVRYVLETQSVEEKMLIQ